MRFVVTDLEFNQPSRSIIQIGAVVLDLQTGEIEPLFDEIVDPDEKIDPFIDDLTGISDADCQEAEPLEQVLSRFWHEVCHSHTGKKMAAWGDDVEILVDVSDDFRENTPKVDAFDFKQYVKLFRFMGGKSSRSGCGLANVVESLDLEFEGQQHDAYDDAYMTAKVMLAYCNEIKTVLG